MSDPARTGPSMRRGSSKQDYATPRPFLDAVERRFGPIECDLAADSSNAVAPRYYGPDHPQGCRDSLDASVEWSKLGGVLWLNPPFADLAPWAAKCASVRRRAGWTLLLTPASVGSNWFAEHVHGQALVLPLSPRLAFNGEPYPKDLILSCFGFGAVGFDPWRWRE